MAQYVQARNAREQLSAIRALLAGAIGSFPPQLLPEAQRTQAVQLAAKCTARLRDGNEASVLRTAERTVSPSPDVRQRLKPRGEAVRASVELFRLLVPPLVAWQRQTEQRAHQFQEVGYEQAAPHRLRNLGCRCVTLCKTMMCKQSMIIVTQANGVGGSCVDPNSPTAQLEDSRRAGDAFVCKAVVVRRGGSRA